MAMEDTVAGSAPAARTETVATRVMIDVVRLGDATWQAIVRGPDPGHPGMSVIGTRDMRRLAAPEQPDVLAVPLPPAAYALSLPPSAPHRALCTAETPEPVHAALAALATRTAAAGETDRFGRYLFDCLIGPELWSAIVSRIPSGKPFELSIGWDARDAALSRLPWELMRTTTGFLGAHPTLSIAITRRASAHDDDREPDPGPLDIAPTALVARPRALFVIGASLDDPSIQAGAEYLGLLRQLRTTGAALSSRVLLEATAQQVRNVVQSFAPSIVHFICHGRIGADGRGRLLLKSDTIPGREEEYVASQIVDLLGPAATRASVVVLNACETAGAADPTTPALAAPLAAELIASGIRVVVGHAGRVADRACRLFTRRFYEALLEGENFAHAAAEGRRTALALGGDPSKTIDWALPVLLLAEDVEPTASIDDASRLRLQRVETRAERYRVIADPRVFCGRLECMDAFSAMLFDRSVVPTRVLAYEARTSASNMDDAKFGKTRLLQEIASYATREGVVPCIVTFVGGDDRPKDAMSLALAITRAIIAARTTFDLPAVEIDQYAIMRLKLWRSGADTPTLPSAVRAQLMLQSGAEQITTPVVRAAIEADLTRLGADARAAGLMSNSPAPIAPVTLLIDDVHEFGDAARELLDGMLTVDGIGTKQEPIPVVIAYTGTTTSAESATATAAITRFFEGGKSFVKRVHLGALLAPFEQRVAYRQLLLHHDPPMVIVKDPEHEQIAFDMLEQWIQGIPSWMVLSPAKPGVAASIEAMRKYKSAVPARDGDALKELRGE